MDEIQIDSFTIKYFQVDVGILPEDLFNILTMWFFVQHSDNHLLTIAPERQMFNKLVIEILLDTLYLLLHLSSVLSLLNSQLHYNNQC